MSMATTAPLLNALVEAMRTRRSPCSSISDSRCKKVANR